MSTDEELLAEVRSVLDEQVADVTAGPALLTAVRREHSRRTTRRRFLAAVPAVAAAVAVVVLMPQASPPPSLPPRPTTPVEPMNAAYVMDKTTRALDTVLDSVVYERAVVTKGDKYSEPGQAAVYERWLASDGSTFRLLVTIDGQPVVDLSRDRVVDVFVDHRTHTYRTLPGAEPSAPDYDDVLTPAEIQRFIADGAIKVAGPDTVDGKPAVKLYSDGEKGAVPMDLWVDATTYLPVRWQWRQDGSTPFDVTWLPPTPANIAKLTTVVPPGFDEEK
jgi:hypothetical protein